MAPRATRAKTSQVARGFSPARSEFNQNLGEDLYLRPKGKRKPSLRRPTRDLHTYVALVEKVVDGDTLIARIDLGFDVWKSQRIRFRGVDAEPLATPKGRKAQKFVEKQLAKAEFIVLKTYQVDMYYRYVADIFYLPGLKAKEEVFAEGKSLNEELVRAGHAEVVI